MDASRRKEIGLHVLISIFILAFFAMWLTYTYKNSPQRMSPPGTPPPEMQMQQGQRHGPPPQGKKGPLRPETMIIILGVIITFTINGIFYSYFKAQKGRQRMKDMENENLNRQLEALRFQINPHIFMNTLNNIHALVDIEPEKAKQCIEEFSKLMRIILYEGNEPTIPLQREIDFLSHLVSLMRIRYPEDVAITTSFPEECEGVNVPPLLMASFVENAFKHGISYEELSFIHVSVVLKDNKLIFRCANSRHPRAEQKEHGLGLENTRKRLDLLYQDRYSLTIDESDKVYDILLILPIC